MSQILPHDHITPFKNAGTGKKEQVADMFNKIAGKYDIMNRLLSARTDIGWRKKAIRLLKKDKPAHILDVATGTADMAIMACKMLDNARVTGIDISTGMLELGRKKVEKEGLAEKIHLHTGDSETINFAENTFDAVMVAFGVRNFENLENGLAEMWRVLKPGGRLVVLEFSKPRRNLNESANAFPDRQLFTDILKKVGYSETEFKPLSLGICCIYSGKKPL